ncbi:acyltransferase [Falsiroseomonas sp.]|uniref:acyltransferase family protein n=1 Tax=Falsiroseomonas sp. TaxID=2870721 RepID=UPI00271C4CC7|nr:acyltransferase [Falsiroseomonas sp.]MDO9499168.1 acyltransferase [Falsiroseomonas sp.]
MSDPTARTPQAFIGGLHGLRGVAAMWVFLYHLWDGWDWSPGHLGVDLFLILSGFVLSHVYAAGLHSAADYRGFIRSRIARIYPLHLVTLLAVATVVMTWPGFAGSFLRPEQRFGADAFLAHLLLVQNWAYFLPTSWNAPAWSLSAEWAGYLAFPGIVLLARRGRQPLLLAVACMAVMSLALHGWGVKDGNGTGSPGMLRMGFGVLAGCLVYRAYAAGLRLPPAPTTLGCVALLAVAHVPGFGGLGTLAFPILTLLCATGAGALAQACASRPAVWLGTLSYSIYLWHWLIIQMANRAVPDWHWLLRDTAVVVVTLAISAASFRCIERPGRSLLLRPMLGKVAKDA